MKELFILILLVGLSFIGKGQTTALAGIYTYTESNGYIDSLTLNTDSTYRYACYYPDVKKSEWFIGKWKVNHDKLILAPVKRGLDGECNIVTDGNMQSSTLVVIRYFGYERKNKEKIELKK